MIRKNYNSLMGMVIALLDLFLCKVLSYMFMEKMAYTQWVSLKMENTKASAKTRGWSVFYARASDKT
ncbi:hypothetical protein SAMN05216225_102741 [Ornithinibacillus halophilus]|uniref:Uncharacterized protein n=1 Tax=Ornithinibacillus halophilus TaxID=930117 RepID=A0A1M5J1E2_9BACI|nr:hypothetical protein SAMN05216225_102741 [Ornithinibacillus halophilus]